jgi:AraC family transcriptional regulator
VKIDLVERAPARVAYLRYTGPFGEPLGRFWRVSVMPWLADHDLIDCPRYGVSVDDPRRTRPETCRYDACVALSPGLTLPDAAQTTIAGGIYAVTGFRGTDAQIGAAWDEFLAAVAGLALTTDAARAAFEHYPRGATWDHRTGTFACELCIPVTGIRRFTAV